MNQPFDEEAISRADADSPDPKAVLAGRWCADEGYHEKGSGSEEMANLALFLASDDSASITGQDINCDGRVMW